jgi:hypothetical protein
MHAERSPAPHEAHRSDPSPALASALARFERPRVTGRPPRPEPLLDTRARAIARAIEDELVEWATTMPDGDVRRVNVTCHVQLVSDGERWVGHTESLGARGTFVATYLQRPIGSDVELRVELPTGRVIDATATVAGHRPPGGPARAGLQLSFGEIAPESVRELSEVMHVMSGELWRELRT